MSKETKSASFIFSDDGVLTHLQHDGKQFDAATLTHTPTGGGTAITLSGNDLSAAITKATEGLPKDKPLGAKHFDSLAGFAKTHDAAFIGGQNPLSHIVDHHTLSEAYKAGDKSAVAAYLVNEAEAGAHLKIIPEENVAGFRRKLEVAKEGSYEAFKTNIADGRKISDKLLATKWSDAKFDKAGSMERHIDSVLGSHHTTKRPVSELGGFISTEASEHITKSGAAYSDASHAIEQFGEKIGKSEAFLTEQAEKLHQLNKKPLFARAATKEANASAAKALEESIAKHLEESAAHGVAYKNLPEHVTKTLNSSSVIKTAGTKAASEVGVEATKSGFRLWTASAEQLAERAAKGASMTGLKGALWNNRSMTGRAAIIGVPVVVAGYMAGIGRNPDKGKYTEQALAQQASQGQGMVVGA